MDQLVTVNCSSEKERPRIKELGKSGPTWNWGQNLYSTKMRAHTYTHPIEMVAGK